MPQLMRLLVYEYDTKSVEDVQVVKSASDNDLQIGIYRYRFLFICPFQRRMFYYFIYLGGRNA